MSQPYRVLDLAGERGAYCSKLLGSIGMQVTKNEDPRALEAREADIVIESFPPGHLDRLGFGYEALHRRNPGLIMASITPFGQDGPYRGFAATDLTVQAHGGQMATCGELGGPPLRLAGKQTNYLGSLFAAIGILLALRERRRTGLGQHIDISLQECVAGTLDHVLPRYFGTGAVAVRTGSRHWNGAFDILPCRDAYIAASFSQRWETLVEWLDDEGMAEELKRAEFADPDVRRANMDSIVEAFARWSRGRSAAELEEQAQAMGFPWAKVNDIEAVSAEPDLPALRQAQGPAWLCHSERSEESVPPRTNTDSSACGPQNDKTYGPSNDTPRRSDAPFGTAVPQVQEPCRGVRVLDLTRVLAGPFATRILADFGAEVVKVQRPGDEETDDFGRAYYQMWNRNKKSIAIDLANPRGLDVLKQLIEQCDLLIENFSPRVMANWGLGYEQVRRIRPDIIIVSISARGQADTKSDYTGFAPSIHAWSGLAHLTAFSPDHPIGPGHAYADHIAGLTAAFGALAALERREQTGEGGHLDVSATLALMETLDGPIARYRATGVDPGPQGNASAENAPSGCYRCRGKDAWCAVEAETDQQWKTLANIVGGAGLAGDLQFASAAKRIAARAEIDSIIQAWTRRRSAARVMDVLQAAGVPAGSILDAAGLASNAQLQSRGFFVDCPAPGLPSFRVDTEPVRLTSTPARYNRVAPKTGQDTDAVLEDLLGMNKSGIASLRQGGVIA